MVTYANLTEKLNLTPADANILSFVSQYPLIKDRKTQKSIEEFYHDKLSKYMTSNGQNVAEYCLGYGEEYPQAVRACGDYLIKWYKDRFERYEKEQNKRKY